MTIYLVTRHLGALEWTKLAGVAFDQHVTHLSAIAALHAGDQVIGTLPIHLVCQLNRQNVRYLHLSLDLKPSERGQELSAKDMQLSGARLIEFGVTQLS